MTCCVCLEENKSYFNCLTCESGKICVNCYSEIDENGIGFLDDNEDIKKIIKCPCCRSLNWKFAFKQIILTTFADFEEWDYIDNHFKYSPVGRLLLTTKLDPDTNERHKEFYLEDDKDETPICVTIDCSNEASFNDYFPNSEGGQYWTLCDECFSKQD